jgi:hypothetical protein
MRATRIDIAGPSYRQHIAKNRPGANSTADSDSNDE